MCTNQDGGDGSVDCVGHAKQQIPFCLGEDRNNVILIQPFQ